MRLSISPIRQLKGALMSIGVHPRSSAVTTRVGRPSANEFAAATRSWKSASSFGVPPSGGLRFRVCGTPTVRSPVSGTIVLAETPVTRGSYGHTPHEIFSISSMDIFP